MHSRTGAGAGSRRPSTVIDGGNVHGVLAMDAYVFGAAVGGLEGGVEVAPLTQQA